MNSFPSLRQFCRLLTALLLTLLAVATQCAHGIADAQTIKTQAVERRKDYTAFQSAQEPKGALMPKRQARPAETLAAESAETQRRLLYILDMNLIQRAWETDDIDEMQSLLEETRRSPYRGWEWGYWNRMAHQEFRKIAVPRSVTPAYMIAASHDGSLLATTGGTLSLPGNGIVIWEMATGRHLRTLVGHTNIILTLDFSPDGRLLLSGGADRTIRVWEVASGRQIAVWPNQPHIVTCARFLPDGSRFTAVFGDRGWEGSPGGIFDAQNGVKLQNLPNAWYQLAVSRDGRLIAAPDTTGQLAIYETASGQILKHMPARNGIKGVDFSPDGERVAIGGESETTVDMLNVSDGSLLWRMPATHMAQERIAAAADFEENRDTSALPRHFYYSISEVRFSADGRSVIVANDRIVRVCDARTGYERMRLKGLFYEDFQGFTETTAMQRGDKKPCIVTAEGGSLRFWSMSERGAMTLSNAKGPAAFTPDGREIVALNASPSQNMPELSLYDTSQGTKIRNFETEKPIETSESSRGFSYNEYFKSFSSRFICIQQLGILTDSRLLEATTLLRAVTPSSFDYGYQDHQFVSHYDMKTGALVGNSIGNRFGYIVKTPSEPSWVGYGFLPSGDTILLPLTSFFSIDRYSAPDIGVAKTLKFYNPVMNVFHSPSLPIRAPIVTEDTVLSPDGTYLVTPVLKTTPKAKDPVYLDCSKISCVIWKIEREQQLQLCSIADDAAHFFGESRPKFAFSPDNRRLYLVNSRYDHLTNTTVTHIHVWNVANGRPTADFALGPTSVSTLLISPDGRRIVLGEERGAISLLDAETGRNVLRIDLDDQNVSSLSFSPDGRRLLIGSSAVAHTVSISSGYSGSVHIFDAEF